MSTRLPPLNDCPICGFVLSFKAAECPRGGESSTDLRAGATEPGEAAQQHAGFRERFLYYAVIALIALILLGRPGITLGSWLHDALRISYLNYNSFDVFGPVNRLGLGPGLIVMIVGVVFLMLSLRLSRPAETEVAA